MASSIECNLSGSLLYSKEDIISDQHDEGLNDVACLMSLYLFHFF